MSDKEFWEEIARTSLQPETEQMPWNRHFKPKEPGKKTILELGTHKGANLLHWAQLGYTCHGNDIAETNKETFERNKNKLNLTNCTYSVEPAEKFRCEEEYDYIVMSSMLESVEDPEKVILSAAMALKPQGQIYIASLRKWWRPPIKTQKRVISRTSLTPWCKAAGLRIDRVEPAGRQQHFLIALAYHEAIWNTNP